MQVRDLRFWLAFILAPIALAILWSSLIAIPSKSLDTFNYVFWAVLTEAFPRALLVGVPIALILRRRCALSFRTALGSGAAMGAIPVVTIYRIIVAPPESLPSAGTAIDVLAPMWQYVLAAIVGGALLGALGGAIWSVLASASEETVKNRP